MYLNVLFSKFLQAMGLTIKNVIRFSSLLVWYCTTYAFNPLSVFTKWQAKMHILPFLGVLDLKKKKKKLQFKY